MPETCENWIGPVHISIYYAWQTLKINHELPYSVDFKAPRELWNPQGKTVLPNCSFNWNKGPVNKFHDAHVMGKHMRTQLTKAAWIISLEYMMALRRTCGM